MINYHIRAGQIDVSVIVRILDSTDGTPETAVVYNTSGLDLKYRREGAANVDITEVTLAALTTSHADGGFLHIGNGYYRLDIPDAACASGVSGCLVHGTCTGMVVVGCYINLNTQNAADVADAVFDEATSGHTTAGTAGKAVIDMLTALTSAISAPGQVAPPATADLPTLVSYLYKAWRNRSTMDATSYKLFADNATTVDQKASFSYGSGTADRGEIAAGP